MLQGSFSVCAVSTLVVVVVVLSFLSEVHGGSPCPPRRDIYPCICTEIPKSRKHVYTIVTCSGMPSTTALSDASLTFKKLQIDRLIIVDSFLEASRYGKEADQHQTLPQNWFSQLRIREMEIVDSELSRCFACDFSEVCRNAFQTHLSIINSSQSNNICTTCQLGNQMRFSWIACLSYLKHFVFKQNKLDSVETDFFPVPMNHLVEVNMSYNMISRVGKEAFKNLPKLVHLDLSHNNLRNIPKDIFGGTKPNLKFLDLSWNHIITISPDVLKNARGLRFLYLQNNLIEKVEENTWKELPQTVLVVNFSDNRITCDCCITWLNSTLKTSTVVQGYCASPAEYNASPLRRASRFLSKKCSGNIHC